MFDVVFLQTDACSKTSVPGAYNGDVVHRLTGAWCCDQGVVHFHSKVDIAKGGWLYAGLTDHVMRLTAVMRLMLR